jgi:hypothetical protein
MSDIIARQAAEILRQDAEIERLRASIHEIRQINRRLVMVRGADAERRMGASRTGSVDRVPQPMGGTL